jgi:hypothetical protein
MHSDMVREAGAAPGLLFRWVGRDRKVGGVGGRAEGVRREVVRRRPPVFCKRRESK